MAKSPLASVKERFGDKAGLIKAVQGLAKGDLWIDRLNSDKGLEAISNAKLLHLHDVLTAVKEQFSSRAKLIEAIVAAEGVAKDAPRKEALGGRSTVDLFEIFNAADKRAKKNAKKNAA